MTSQSNEDAIVKRLFSLIGEGNRRFVEFGCGDGRQNNTIALLERGWSGTWIEPHRRRRYSAIERWQGYPVEIMARRRVTARNVNKLVVGELDFLSMDTDGDDYEIWKALDARPRIVCVELGHPVPCSDLARFLALGRSKGYILVALSDSRVNGFFWNIKDASDIVVIPELPEASV